MVAGAIVAFILATGAGQPDTLGQAPAGPRLDGLRAGIEAAPGDTTKPRKKAFQLSEAYEQRLKIHKLASYATLPLFVAEYLAGDQLMKKGSAAPSWAVNTHGPLATGVAALFAVNTYTGALNWWETRGQSEGRAWRTTHAALMLLADAGFVATGVLSDQAEGSGDKRRQHRNVAVGSMSVATLSYVMMLSPFRRD
jgi:hypothetical protein